MNCEDIIVNLATPMGTGAISVIRCSGENVLEISKIFLDKKLEPRYAHYAKFKNKNNVVIDDVVVIFYEGPRSYTGENMIEIMCHGGPVIYQLLIKEILKMDGCRLAKAGEFSERAFLNNKMSLFEAEATCALINAKTEEAALAARESLSGKLSQDLLIIDNALLKTRIQVEALLDFSEEDIETDGLLTIEKHINDCKKKIHILVERLEKNRLLFETSKIAIIGKPNSGKSSLINLLTNLILVLFSPIKSSITNTCPSQLAEEPIPIVGIFICSVIFFANFVSTHSNTTEKIPASSNNLTVL